MKLFKENDMFRGWFVGNFNPTAFSTDNCEVALKKYKAGDFEDSHYHKISTEITMIVYGEVEMNEIIYKEGDIILIEPNESTYFKAITDCANVVVKVPCSKNDKYLDVTDIT